MSREESLEDQSFINLVKHYEKELRMILNGAPFKDVLDDHDLKTLRNRSILTYLNKVWLITKKARDILEMT
jgi:hypothetical protein